MMNINSILKEYRNGDFEKRLYLFLNYRDLRDEFTGIDESDFNMKHIHQGARDNENAIINLYDQCKAFF